MTLFADLLSTLFERSYREAVGEDDRGLEDLCRDLLTRSGEVSGLETARRIFDRYAALDDGGKRDFFRFLADEMDIDADALGAAVAGYRAHPGRAAYRTLMSASDPKRQELARRLNRADGATSRLVEMRADLLRLMGDDQGMARLDLDLHHLFGSWFNKGFLVLYPITWSSPADVLEKIIAYEAVHAIGSWDDLRRRLAPEDRRCYGFFHPAVPDEPLIFVEVALTRGAPGSIQALLAEDRAPLSAGEADTAVFYSISNCQAGLAGVSFGNSLIKQVVADLNRELPHLTTFVTLSPIPGLAAWLTEAGIDPPDDAALREAAAAYLLRAKGRGGAPRDPVARFHLGNGALVHDVHAGADISDRGMAQSRGAMVNYLYDPARIAENHEAFAADGAVVAAKAVSQLAAACPAAASPRTSEDA